MNIPENLRIVRLEAENIKRLTAVAVEPTGATVIVSGRNGQGKSSLIDSIAYALGGKGLVPDEPIRRGQDSARVSVDLGELVVTRVFTASGSYLTVTNDDGAKYPSPQKLLDGLVGALCFDPTEFSRLDRTARAKLLMELVGLDLSEMDQQRQAIYEERTAVNRQAKNLRASLEQMPEAPEGTPDVEVSIAELASEYERLSAQRAENDRQRKKLEEAEASYSRTFVDIERLEDRILDLEKQLDRERKTLALMHQQARDQEADIEVQRTTLKQLTDPDLAECASRMEQAEATNQAVRQNRARQERAADVASTEAEADSLTAKLAALDEKKAEAVAAADYPVEALAADGDGVTYQGIPFEQCSSAEQLRISLEVGWALNPKLRVMLVRQGNDLDDESLDLVRQSAVEHEGQLWIESIRGGDGAIVIENGAVVAAPGGEAETEAG